MQYNPNIMVVFYFLITIMALHAAENKNTSSLYEFERIPIVGDLCQVIHISNNRIAVNTLGECNIIDLKTKEVFHLHDADIEVPFKTGLVLHRGKIIADVGEKAIIYDIQTNERSYLEERILGIIPIPNTDNVFFNRTSEKSNKLIEYDCKTKEVKDLIVKDKLLQMKIHSSEKIVCVPDIKRLIFYELGHWNKIVKIIPFCRMSFSFICESSSKGFLIAVGNNAIINIIDSRENEPLHFIEAEKEELFVCAKFHPDDIHLGLLSNYPGSNGVNVTIKLFNLETKKCINLINLGCSFQGIDLSFSENGLQFVAGLERECLRGFVPFAVEKACLHLLCWLYRFKEQGKIPHDIVRHCLSVFLRTYVF